MEAQEDTAPRPLPAWLSIPIILLCLGGGGWIIHWYVMTDSTVDESHVLTEVPATPSQPQPPGGRRGGFGRGAWVRELNNGRYAVSGTVATAVAGLAEAKHTLRVTYSNPDRDISGPATKKIKAARLLVEGQDKKKIAAMKLTDDQLQKIRGLSQPPEAPLSPPQRDAILTAFEAYKSAGPDKKPEAAEKLRQLVDETATQLIPATKALFIDRAAKLDAIVTPEQWKLDTDMGGGV